MKSTTLHGLEVTVARHREEDGDDIDGYEVFFEDEGIEANVKIGEDLTDDDRQSIAIMDVYPSDDADNMAHGGSGGNYAYFVLHEAEAEAEEGDP